MKLVKLSDFVLEKDEAGLFKNSDEQIRRYAEFLQRDLELSMFLPCDENGNVLIEPQKTDFLVKEGEKCSGWDYIDFDNNDKRYYNKPAFESAVCKYMYAIERTIFQPISFIRAKHLHDSRFYSVGATQVFNISDDNNKHLYWHHYTVESLVNELDETIEFTGFI